MKTIKIFYQGLWHKDEKWRENKTIKKYFVTNVEEKYFLGVF